MKRLLPVFLPLFLFPCGFGQTVFIVDAAGGAGSSFKDLPQAVSSVPDGSVLRVRPGSYSGFALSGKGLFVIGDDKDKVFVTSQVKVGPTKKGQPVLFEDFKYKARNQLEVTGASGVVTMRRISTGSGPGGMKLSACANACLHECSFGGGKANWTAAVEVRGSSVLFSSCEITGPGGVGMYPPSKAGAAGIYVEFSRIEMAGTNAKGGEGAYLAYPFKCGNGGPGVVLAKGANLVALGGEIQGGRGGGGATPSNGGDGGTGLELRMGSKARVEGLLPRGGGGGPVGGRNGQGILKDASSLLALNPKSMPAHAELIGEPAWGKGIIFHVKGRPGSGVFLFLGIQSLFSPLDPYVPGYLFFNPIVLLAGPNIDSAGSSRIPLGITPGWPLNIPVLGQSFVVEPGFQIFWMSNSVVVLLKS